jgi:hypothetical protein
MRAQPLEPTTSVAKQRGFTVLETAVGIAILSAFVLATASLGSRPPQAHAAAIGLEAALVEARSVAVATADQTDPAWPTGATVYVAPDPANAGRSVVSVYRSRPIPNGNPGAASGPLSADAGFPPEHLAAALSVRNGVAASAAPFAILVSSSGYASVAAPLAWDPGASGARLTADPGCMEDAVTIAADDGTRTESHPLSCRDASFDAAR